MTILEIHQDNNLRRKIEKLKKDKETEMIDPLIFIWCHNVA